MKPWHLIAAVIVAYVLGVYFPAPFNKAKSVVTGAVGAA